MSCINALAKIAGNFRSEIAQPLTFGAKNLRAANLSSGLSESADKPVATVSSNLTFSTVGMS